MATDLNAILTGTVNPEPVSTPDPEPSGTPEPERVERFDEELDDGWDGGENGDQSGDKPPEQPEPSVPPAEEEDAAKSVPVKALQEERRKRQELEKRLAEFERQQPSDQAELGRKPDEPQDPVRQRLDLSVEYAREQFPDYEDAETAFIEAVKTYPRGQELYRAMLEDRHPARFAYEIGQQLMALNEIGDPRTFKQRVMAEAKAATAPAPKPSPSLPQTLAASRDSGGRFSPRDSAAPTPLGEILAR